MWWMTQDRDDDGDQAVPAPAPPVVTESFAFGAPVVADAADAPVNLGTLFAVTVAGSVVGIDWHTPLVAPGVAPAVALWNADTVTLLGSALVGPVVVGTVQRTLFAVAAAVVPGVNYVAQIWTDRYTATLSYPSWPVTTVSMHTGTTNPGRLLYGAAPAYAPNTTDSCYFVGPVGVF